MTETPPPSKMRRRLLTTAGFLAVGAWVWGVPRLIRAREAELTFQELSGVPGFQRLVTNTNAGLSSALFFGLETPDPDLIRAMDLIPANTCRLLFRGSQAEVPIALFSDFNCPNCPQMDANVAAVVADTPTTSLTYHQLPLLGRTSETASFAVLAASKQGKYAEMHEALLRTPAITNIALVTSLAEKAGLDVERFTQDMSSPEVTGSVTMSKALAQYFGLIGTPATIIGKTVVLGVQSEATIAAIIAHEIERGVSCS